MASNNPSLQFFLNLARIQAVMARRFDSRLGGGLGFNDFVILYHLSQAEGEKMRRGDLAEAIGLTASGVTRLLAPMEKIGLIQREADARDARVSFVMLAPGGKRLLGERLERAEMLSDEVIPRVLVERIGEYSEALSKISGNLTV